MLVNQWTFIRMRASPEGSEFDNHRLFASHCALPAACGLLFFGLRPRVKSFKRTGKAADNLHVPVTCGNIATGTGQTRAGTGMLG